MSKFKKYFAKKKQEAALRLKIGGGMGTGRALNAPKPEPSTSKKRDDVYIPPERKELSSEARNAANAALARCQKKTSTEFNTSLAAIKAQVRREREAEQKLKDAKEQSSSVSIQSQAAVNQNLACEGVFFRCPLISEELLSKKEWQPKIKEFLYEQLEFERALTSCLIIWNCNVKEKTDECIETIAKYLENIINHPDEEKYCKIRMENRIFSEKVRHVEGSIEFLKAAGFREVEIDGEPFLLWSKDYMEQDFDLPSLLDALKNAEVIQLEIDRNITVLLPSQAKRDQLPNDFYRMSSEEIKREQELRTQAIQSAQVLRTKAMRERDEKRNLKMYRYSLIRVKLPDGIRIQGTFNIFEKISNVFEFVQSCLAEESLEFNLITLTEGILGEDDMDQTLHDMRFVPTATLMFTVPGIPTSQLSETNFLKEELLMLVQSS